MATRDWPTREWDRSWTQHFLRFFVLVWWRKESDQVRTRLYLIWLAVLRSAKWRIFWGWLFFFFYERTKTLTRRRYKARPFRRFKVRDFSVSRYLRTSAQVHVIRSLNNSHRLLEKLLFRLFEACKLDYCRLGLSVFNWSHNASSLQADLLLRLQVGLNDRLDRDWSSEELQSLLLGRQKAPCC
jgi:hypothetical protein